MVSDFDTLDDSLGGEGLAIKPNDAGALRTAAKWARFMAIVGFVLLGLAVIGLLFSINSLSALQAAFGVSGGVFFLGYIVLLAIQALVPFFLWQFSSKALLALNSNSSLALTESFAGLRNLMIFFGVIVAIIVAIYLFFFAFAIIASL